MSLAGVSRQYQQRVKALAASQENGGPESVAEVEAPVVDDEGTETEQE